MFAANWIPLCQIYLLLTGEQFKIPKTKFMEFWWFCCQTPIPLLFPSIRPANGTTRKWEGCCRTQLSSQFWEIPSTASSQTLSTWDSSGTFGWTSTSSLEVRFFTSTFNGSNNLEDKKLGMASTDLFAGPSYQLHSRSCKSNVQQYNHRLHAGWTGKWTVGTSGGLGRSKLFLKHSQPKVYESFWQTRQFLANQSLGSVADNTLQTRKE